MLYERTHREEDGRTVTSGIPRGVHPEPDMRFLASLGMTEGEGLGMTGSEGFGMIGSATEGRGLVSRAAAGTR